MIAALAIVAALLLLAAAISGAVALLENSLCEDRAYRLFRFALIGFALGDVIAVLAGAVALCTLLTTVPHGH